MGVSIWLNVGLLGLLVVLFIVLMILRHSQGQLAEELIEERKRYFVLEDTMHARIVFEHGETRRHLLALSQEQEKNSRIALRVDELAHHVTSMMHVLIAIPIPADFVSIFPFERYCYVQRQHQLPNGHVEVCVPGTAGTFSIRISPETLVVSGHEALYTVIRNNPQSWRLLGITPRKKYVD